MWKSFSYSINTKGAPEGAIEAIKAAFETWDTAIEINLFDDEVGTVTREKGNRFDGKNVISWGGLRRNVIAQTTIWWNDDNEIVEFGMVFNKNFEWGIDTDGEEPGFVLENAFDIQNIATHEAGHTLLLLDLYMPEACALTMYGYGDYGETYARSLGTGDISGITAIYGN